VMSSLTQLCTGQGLLSLWPKVACELKNIASGIATGPMSRLRGDYRQGMAW
jgi:hypothetical protein